MCTPLKITGSYEWFVSSVWSRAILMSADFCYSLIGHLIIITIDLTTVFPLYVENLEFRCILFQAWKMPGICFKKSSRNHRILTQSLENNTWVNSVFQDTLFKLSFTKEKIYILHLCHIFNINIHIVISNQDWPGISLIIPGNNLENAWNILSPEKWEPWTTFFLGYVCGLCKNLLVHLRGPSLFTEESAKILGSKAKILGNRVV